jgi:hypothetical protein
MRQLGLSIVAVKTTLTFRWECAACSFTAEQSWSIPPGAEYVKPSLPTGWREQLGAAVCPQHRLMTTILLVDAVPIREVREDGEALLEIPE